MAKSRNKPKNGKTKSGKNTSAQKARATKQHAINTHHQTQTDEDTKINTNFEALLDLFEDSDTQSTTDTAHKQLPKQTEANTQAKGRDITYSFRLNSELKRMFADTCKANDTNASQQLRKMMRDYLQNSG